ncbi:MAG: transcriptional regulator [Deltaproteobacteria bacterium]|nr:transcriptional regulator [Deltaproteobacteria bacterium]
MVRILLIALAAFVVYKLFTTDFRKKCEAEEKDKKTDFDKKAASGELVKDPTCNAYVSVEDSIRVRDGDKVYHFCSYECRDKFLKQLERGGREIPATTGPVGSDQIEPATPGDDK